MKTAPAAALRVRPFHRHSPGQQSSALLIVLGCLVLISVLIVAFFYAVTAERQSAQLYANTSSVKMLADSTVSIVQGQIKNATKGTDTSGNTLAWASQPGMIRTYNTQGQAAGFYKLYSWNNMVTTSFNPTSASELPPTTYAGWAGSPAIYTDLNEPVSGVYPIVDPAAKTILGVKGFDYNTSGMTNATGNALPMPVKWLYVLQSGQVIAPDTTSTGNTASFTQAAIQPTATNAIVARIAFWTDDDTCKVNVNTAAGEVWVNSASPPAVGSTVNPGNPGSFWDTPRIGSLFEQTNAYYQPANGEYQRYPGHPATTYLSAVFPSILTNAASIYSLAPRVSLGGSLSGTTYPGASTLSANDSDRLYSSVDELLLSATNMVAGSPPTRVANSPLTKANLEQARFFLTAASRAPEVNLFNEPRVVIWPISSVNDAAHRTAYDNLIAYCGTLYNSLYYFQRGPLAANSGSKSSTADLPAPATTGLGRNKQLISYLRNLTSLPIPGFSQTNTDNFSHKYGDDRDQILTEIFDYIRALNTQDQAVTSPYTTATFASGEGQILPITDTGGASGTVPLRGFGHMPVITEASLLFWGRAETSADGNQKSFTFPDTAATAPAQGFSRIQTALLLKFFDPCQGYATYIPNFKVSISGLNGMNWSNGATLSSPTSVGFKTGSGSAAMVNVTASEGLAWGEGELGITQFVYGANYIANCVGTGTLDVQTIQPGTPPTLGVFTISDTPFKVQIYDSTGTILLQTYNLDFPQGTFPVPQLAPMVTDLAATSPQNGVADFRNASDRFNTSNSNMLQTFICSKDTVRSIALIGDPRLLVIPNVPSTAFAKIYGYDPLVIPGPPASTTYINQAHGIIGICNGNHRGYIGAELGKFVNGANYFGGGASPDFVYTPGVTTPPAPATPPAPLTYFPGVQSTVTGGTTAGTWSGQWKGAFTADPTAFILSGNYAVAANGVTVGSTALPGDWDTGTGSEKDGAYINKADEGAVPYNKGPLPSNALLPYYGAGYATSTVAGSSMIIAQGANFSPNRQMPSAGMFGSLPTGVIAGKSYQTLLFRPSPDAANTHVGAQIPPDYLMLDLFNMPIVEPYAISDPFSTAGKINMNYQMVPFTYITRSTAVQAAMRSEEILALPATQASTYKAQNVPPNLRHFLDLSDTTGTLLGFKNMFATGTTDGTGSTPDIFRSASQICSIWLVPDGMSLTYSGMQAFWQSNAAAGGLLTGDNVRERPYTNLYQHLTTKSNTYTVHMRVQTLKKIKSTDPTTWVEGADVISGEYRGSTTMERYLDPNDTTHPIPDYATLSQPLTAGQAIDNYYKFRVIETKQFTP